MIRGTTTTFTFTIRNEDIDLSAAQNVYVTLAQGAKLIEKAVVSPDDADALEAVELFPPYAVGVAYAAGVRFRYGAKLYKVLQAHTSQEDWKPDSAPSIYAEVEKPGEGDSPDNPIAYSGNMELFSGKYYSQNGVVYRCFRDTGVPVYNALRDLVGLYVEVVE